MERWWLWQAGLWGLVLALAWLSMLAMRRAIRPTQEQSQRWLKLSSLHTSHGRHERTLQRWSRIVKHSHSAFWTHVSQRHEPRQ
ncbi:MULTISPECIES: hypothetical protein [unclassified Paludibacterium]|uniref:hypothetical protein n=1 Tax=unclassified Paludibacterium TaxID=2618429 RepID=UPI001C0553D6|nr:hypothetical protein [Paludibacterium sp. B53371]BEV72937.1 hypothetical protein THUN1379_24190 [Paludibacterium sp. THUN1379]